MSAPEQTAERIAQAARAAAGGAVRANADKKNAALLAFARIMRERRKDILEANAKDMAGAGSLSDALKDRLRIDEARAEAMCRSVEDVAALPDPVGEMADFDERPSGIRVGKMRVPLGVILAIYESRPNVTADIAALALKSGNAAILRGGSEALNSNVAIGECMTAALQESGLPETAVQVVSSGGRAIVNDLLAREEIDLAVPRGGRGLIERVLECARMPVLRHLDGNCHVYVDAAADLDMAEKIAVNAKTRRTGVCNAAESLLVHAEVAERFIPRIAAAFEQRGVEIRGCSQTQKLAPSAATANEEDWRTEYLAPIISVKVVKDEEEAIEHINEYGSGHTDAVVTENQQAADKFLREVDSSSVMHNASTSFADGGEYGLGAEVGISTSKLHARGPVGLRGLTSEKYVVLGEGNVRAA